MLLVVPVVPPAVGSPQHGGRIAEFVARFLDDPHDDAGIEPPRLGPDLAVGEEPRDGAIDVHDILGQDHEVGRADDLLHHGKVTCGDSSGVGEDSGQDVA